MGLAAVIAVAGGVQGNGDEGAGSCIGKNAGSVAVRNSGADSDGGSSATEAAVVIAGRRAVAVAAVSKILRATVAAVEAEPKL